ncbi:KCNAB2 [Cordylochernes scorpioides]|uniref:KCNAB2 n=1 Tax=Cordylochernes scorpioides TaxID=51811 RepID=A0ABY6LIL3_9ARAC|nr:KCNAB2 [Cordylochernes scorpioides]
MKMYPRLAVLFTKGMLTQESGENRPEGLQHCLRWVGAGAWTTFGSQLSEENAEELVSLAYESGINLFDTGDIYALGKSEVLLGKILSKKNWRNDTLQKCLCLRSRDGKVRCSRIRVLSTGDPASWSLPNSSGGNACDRADSDRGLSRKHIIEGRACRHPSNKPGRRRLCAALQASLARLQLGYVDIMLIHKTDPMCPMEEVVRACTFCVDQGWALYWGTSRWSTVEIMEAYVVARQFQLVPPTVEQTEYHMLKREKVEVLMPEIFHKIGVGCISWCPLGFTVEPGKFDEGISKASLKVSLQRKLSSGWCGLRNEEVGCVFQAFLQPKDMENGLRADHAKMLEVTAMAELAGCSLAQLSIERACGPSRSG